LLASTRQGLKHKNPHVQRLAAEALGRHSDDKAFVLLVDLINQVPEYDTHLRYTAQLALKNHLQAPAIMQQAVAGKWSTSAANTIAVVAADVLGEQLLPFYASTCKPSRYPRPDN